MLRKVTQIRQYETETKRIKDVISYTVRPAIFLVSHQKLHLEKSSAEIHLLE